MKKWAMIYDSSFNLKVENIFHAKDGELVAADSFNGGIDEAYVRLVATHSGMAINNRLYPPDKMAAGSLSFMEPYPAPLLKNHDQLSEPLGRVVKVRYVDTSNVLRKINTKDSLIDDSAVDSIQQLVDGKLNENQSLEVINKHLLDSGLIQDENYQGLGYIELVIHVTDADALQKFKDKRYLTGSVGFVTDHAFCTICDSDWVEDGTCDHRPGEMYDNRLCLLVTGNLKYKEYSVVNSPADPFSQVIEIYNSDEKEPIRRITLNNSIDSEFICDVPVALIQNFNKDGDDMQNEIVDYEQLLEDSKGDWDYISKYKWLSEAFIRKYADKVNWQLICENQRLSELFIEEFADKVVWEVLVKCQDLSETFIEKYKSKLGLDNEKSEDNSSADSESQSEMTDNEEGNQADNEDQSTDSEDNADESSDSNDDNSDDISDNNIVELTDEEAEDIIEKILNGDASEEEIEKLNNSIFDSVEEEDAKLSTEKRKKLPSSAFCGPNRSFPVNDCAHYTAAKKLLGRYKGEGDKSKIAACIERKGRTMGCAGAKKDSEEDKTDSQPVEFKVESIITEDITNEQLEVIYNHLFEKLNKTDEITALKEDRDLLLEQICDLEEKICNLLDKIEEIEGKYEDSLRGLSPLQDRLILQQKDMNELKHKYYKSLKLFSGQNPESIDFTKLSEDGITSEIVSMEDSIDITKIYDKLTDGMANQPNTDPVDSPIGDGCTEERINEEKASVFMDDDLKEKEFNRLTKDKGIHIAIDWLRRVENYIQQQKVSTEAEKDEAK